MKYRTEARTRVVQHGPAGQERSLLEHYDVKVPKVPADWDARAIKFASVLVLTLTLVAVVWSTYSIGAVLHGGVGYGAASLFDLAWLVNVLLEWLSRFDAAKRGFSRRLSWALLACTMGAIMWHGLLVGSVALAIVGAAVSLFAKVLWMGIMRFVDRDLSDLDRQWVEAEISKANAMLAVASVRRMVARSEARSAMELLAAEQTRQEFAELLKDSATPAALPPESVFGDAVTSRRHEAISPAGAGADIRTRPATAQVSTAPAAADLRPEVPSLRPVFQVPEPEQVEDEGQAPEPSQASGPSLASAVRSLVEGGVTDPKVITAAVPALIGRMPNPESVAREIRNAKSRVTSRDPHLTGPYL